LNEAEVQAAVDRAEPDLIKACQAADIVVLAMPAVELEATLSLIGDKLQAHALVLDLSELKAPGQEFAKKYIKQGFYVGARPVLSAETFADLTTGLDAARADLFRNSTFCVMAAADTDPGAIDTAVTFGRLLGAKPYFVDAREYDILAQGVETMPALMGGALFRAVTRSSGWRDMLRFADLPFAVGTLPLDTDAENLAYLALHDREATLRWLDALAAEVTDLRRWIQEGEQETLAALLADLDLNRRRWLKERSDNEWEESSGEALDMPSMSQHFFGSLARRGKKS
jgi:prephenate dehydrogenase